MQAFDQVSGSILYEDRGDRVAYAVARGNISSRVGLDATAPAVAPALGRGQSEG